MRVPEEEIGISVYWTEGAPGIGGKLKKSPEDFVVDEISVFPPEDPNGDYTAAVVLHRNWEMNRLVRRLGTNLRVGRGRIAFAGTKDKRSVATQLMTFAAPPEAVATIYILDVEFLRIYRTRVSTALGSLYGNRFRIVIRDADTTDLEERVETVGAGIEELGGFPNFFGVQRFGVVRPITHLIGKAIVQGDFERAVMMYIAEQADSEGDESKEARSFVLETRNFEQALRRFPKNLVFERTLLGHLLERPNDFPGALKRLPRNLIMMFVHAYQSYLFNQILSKRIERKLPLDTPLEGDIILPLDKHGLPNQRRQIRVNSSNISLASSKLREGKGFVSGSLFGADTAFAEGEMGEIEHEVVENEKLKASDFIVPEIITASSKGIRRELLAPVRDLRWRIVDSSAFFSFELNKGCYATSLLREYMKAGMMSY